MTDVFLSYASEDRERASRLARSLESCGWSVWWDRKIIAGQTFDQAIEHELETAKSVVVLWSRDSISSEWVKNEAAVAAERGVLVPALIDPVKLPLEFRRKQAADLIRWNGDPSHEGFQALCDGIAAKATNVRYAAPRRPAITTSRSGFRWNQGWALGAVAVIVMVLGLGVYWALRRVNQQPLAKETRKPAQELTGAERQPVALADLVAGTYYGGVISDAKGSSRSDVTVTIAKVDNHRVRITSDYKRLGTTETDLTRVGNSIQNTGGGPLLLLELDRNPPVLSYNPDGSVAYGGQKQ
jgi:TIR domain